MSQRSVRKPVLTIDLGENGGKHYFGTAGQVVKWLESELDKWTWLEAADDTGATWIHVRNVLNGTINWTRDTAANGTLLSANPEAQIIPPFRDQTPRVYHSNSETGRAILLMRQEQGDRAAALSYSLLSGHIGIDLRRFDHLRAVMLTAFPTLLGAEAAARSFDATVQELNATSSALTAEQAAHLAKSRSITGSRRPRR